MRIFAAAMIAIVALIAGDAAAEAACKRRGKVLFTEETSPLRDATTGTADVSSVKLKIYATGGWSLVEQSGDGPTTTTGCLSKVHLKELNRALGKAKFKLVTVEATCRALANESVLITSPKRKKKVRAERPCGTPLDVGTANLLACAELLVEAPDAKRPASELRMICRGEE